MLAVFSALLVVCVLPIREPMLRLFGASDASYPYADQYFTIYLCGTFFALMATGMNQFIICQGYAKTGMMTVLLGAVLNIVLDPVFIFLFGLGVRGAAIATVISQFGSCVYVLAFLFRGPVGVRITLGGYDLRVMRRVLTIGLTPFIIIALDNVMIIAMNAVLRAQHAVGIVTLHEDGSRLQAGFVAVQIVQNLHVEAVARRKARVHAVQHLGPVLRFGAARACVERQDGVVGVVLAGHQRHQTDLFRLFLQLVDALLGLGGELFIVGLFAHLHQRLRVGEHLRELRVFLQLVLDLAHLREHRARVGGVVVERGVGAAVFEFVQPDLALLDCQSVGQVGDHRRDLGQAAFHFV